MQPGESLIEIAERHGIDVDSLLALNPLEDPDVIPAGTSLRVPLATAAQASAPSEDHW